MPPPERRFQHLRGARALAIHGAGYDTAPTPSSQRPAAMATDSKAGRAHIPSSDPSSHRESCPG